MDKKIDVERFLKKLDTYFNSNDLTGAGEYLRFWENEARVVSDDRALLTILNEFLGLCRRVNDKEKAILTIDESTKLIDKLKLNNSISAATILINAATTSSHFGKINEGLILYDKAKKCYIENNMTNTFEYATLLNNSAGALNNLKKYDEAEKNYKEAIEILKKLEGREAEIGLSYVMLAHITFDRSQNPDDAVYEKVESLLDESIKYLTSKNIKRDGNFAFILDKCAPSFEYFKRNGQAKAMKELSNEIYSGGM
jgi:tetratricopeptide (TPR) repeat protein